MEKYSETNDRNSVFKKAETLLLQKGFNIIKVDKNRPWGGFFVIEENQSQAFIASFFEGMDARNFSNFEQLSPKLLLVAPHKRLSWQYHLRRAEIWKVAAGSAGIVISDTDAPGALRELKKGDAVNIEQGQRHRLVGLDEWGMVAEIWKHTDPANLSDEQDIVRLEDDFGRAG